VLTRDLAGMRIWKGEDVGVNWSNKREMLSWLVLFFLPIGAMLLAVIFPLMYNHPIIFIAGTVMVLVAGAIYLLRRGTKHSEEDQTNENVDG